MDFQEQLKMRLKKRAESSAGKPPPLEPMSFEEQLKNRLKKRSEEQSITEEMLVVVLADYQATDDEQLGLTSGETVVMLIEDYGNGWAYGCSLDGARRGMFPQTFVEKAKK
nr:hypothetical protein HK105_003864 [Polyrhizophydium stewartii]